MKKLIIVSLGKHLSFLISKVKLKKLFGYFKEVGWEESSISLFTKYFDANNKFQDPRWWEGQRIDIERAAEPTNVYWENMAITFSSRLKRTLITYSIAFICLGIVFWINLGLNIWRDLLQTTAEKSSGMSAEIYIIIMLIGIWSSIVVAVNNIILTKIIRIISKYERHETYTKYNVSVALKLTLSMFTNTGVIPLIINLGNTNWFGYGGLVVDIFLLMITINFLTPITHLFDVEIFLKKFLILIEKCKGNKSTTTQRSANEYFEGPDFDISMRYATVMMILMMTAFYTPLIPIIPIISFFGAILAYWTEKFSLLRISKIPQEFAEEMSLKKCL